MIRQHWFQTTFVFTYKDDNELHEDLGTEAPEHHCVGALDLDEVILWHEDPRLAGALQIMTRDGTWLCIVADSAKFNAALKSSQEAFVTN